MNNLPIVDVVIPTLNCETTIGECLRCLRMQDYEGKINILIIDGGSIDKTISICKEYNCEVYIIPGIYATGLKGARDISLEFCKGELNWQIDSDNFVPDSRTLTKLVDPFKAIPDIQISMPLISYSEHMSPMDKWFAVFHKIQIERMKKEGKHERNWVLVNDMTYGITNAALIRTDLIQKVGGYDSDVRVLSRAREKGLSKGVIVTDTYYYHIEGGSFLKFLKKQERRIKKFGAFSDNDIKNYFVEANKGHEGRKNIQRTPLLFLEASYLMLLDRKIFFYWGILVLIIYLFEFLIHPIKFLNTYRKFL